MALHMYHSLFLSLRPTRRRKLYHTYTYTQTGAYLEMIISTSIFTSDAAQHGRCPTDYRTWTVNEQKCDPLVGMKSHELLES